MIALSYFSYPAQLVYVPSNNTIDLCTNSTLTCEGYGIPAPTITWKHKGVQLDMLSIMDMVYYNASNGIAYVSSNLSINSVKYQDGGLYMCNIHNEVGNDTAMSTLSVNHEGIHQSLVTEFKYVQFNCLCPRSCYSDKFNN